MKVTATLGRYIAKNFIFNFLTLFLGLLAIVYLFDMVELIRRASKFSDVPMDLIFQMGLLKLPEVGQILFPFAILFSGIYTFWQLTKNHELVIMRSAGFSVWQFLYPPVLCAVLIALLQITVINPAGALFITKYEQLENRYLERQDSQIAFFKEGLWLRQNLPQEKGYVILRAAKVSNPDWRLKNVTVVHFNNKDQFQSRIDAQFGKLLEGEWLFENVTYHGNADQPIFEDYKHFRLETTLTKKDIEDSFASPEALSFWKLPEHIRTLSETGFDATKLRVHYQSLLSQPLMFAAMILLAATVSMRMQRSQRTFFLIVIGISVGFIVFFLSSFLQALGSSGQLPPILAAWSPALIFFSLGLTTIMMLEDG